MALYHKLGVKTGFTFAPQFFLFIDDGLDGEIRFLPFDLSKEFQAK
jgi:hypothetical protein